MADYYEQVVFIVEDSEFFSAKLKMEVEHMLRNVPFRVYTFSTVERALECSTEYPSLILMDYHLDSRDKNAVNGLQGIDIFKKQFPAADFILITSDQEAELFLRSQDYPIYDYLLKGPHIAYQLNLTIDRWLKLHKYMQ